jgi:hypothetical protein
MINLAPLNKPFKSLQKLPSISAQDSVLIEEKEKAKLFYTRNSKFGQKNMRMLAESMRKKREKYKDKKHRINGLDSNAEDHVPSLSLSYITVNDNGRYKMWGMPFQF